MFWRAGETRPSGFKWKKRGRNLRGTELPNWEAHCATERKAVGCFACRFLTEEWLWCVAKLESRPRLPDRQSSCMPSSLETPSSSPSNQRQDRNCRSVRPPSLPCSPSPRCVGRPFHTGYSLQDHSWQQQTDIRLGWTPLSLYHRRGGHRLSRRHRRISRTVRAHDRSVRRSPSLISPFCRKIAFAFLTDLQRKVSDADMLFSLH